MYEKFKFTSDDSLDKEQLLLLDELSKSLAVYNSDRQQNIFDKDHLQKIIDACEMYLMGVKKFKKNDKTQNNDNAHLHWPYAFIVQEIQKEAVSRWFLPTAETETKARVELLRQIITDEHMGQELPAGKLLEKDYWSEFKFGGKQSIADWVKDSLAKKTSSSHDITSFSDIMKEESRILGIAVKDVKYSEEPHIHKIEINDGLLSMQGKLLDTTNSIKSIHNIYGAFLFAADRAGTLYAIDPQQSRSQREHNHHSTMLSGKRVMCSGTLVVENGKLINITGFSGHYRPGPKELTVFLKLLKDRYSVDLSEVTVQAHGGREISAQHYLDMEGFTLPAKEDRSSMLIDLAEDALCANNIDMAHACMDKAVEIGNSQNDYFAKYARAMYQMSDEWEYVGKFPEALSTLLELYQLPEYQVRIKSQLQYSVSCNQQRGEHPEETQEMIKVLSIINLIDLNNSIKTLSQENPKNQKELIVKSLHKFINNTTDIYTLKYLRKMIKSDSNYDCLQENKMLFFSKGEPISLKKIVGHIKDQAWEILCSNDDLSYEIFEEAMQLFSEHKGFFENSNPSYYERLEALLNNKPDPIHSVIK